MGEAARTGRFADALDAAPIVLIARAISNELTTLESLPADTAIGAGGFPGGGRVTFEVERVVRGQAPDVLVLELPVCRPKPDGADCFSIPDLRSFTGRRVILFLGDESLSPALAGKARDSVWVVTKKRLRLLE